VGGGGGGVVLVGGGLVLGVVFVGWGGVWGVGGGGVGGGCWGCVVGVLGVVGLLWGFKQHPPLGCCLWWFSLNNDVPGVPFLSPLSLRSALEMLGFLSK